METKTFRNKLSPNQEETWSFQVTREDKKEFNLEFLASMYDMSLDQFVYDDWNPISFYENSTKYRPKEYGQLTALSRRQINFILPYSVIPQPRLFFDNINKFGLSIDNFPRKYDNYLRYKSAVLRRLKPVMGKIVGRVIDPSGEPVFGSTVQIKDTQIFTTTDFDGLFSIEANKKDILVFTYTDYYPIEKKVGSNRVMEIQLGSGLDEVVVIGYNTTEKYSVVSAVSVVTSTKLHEETSAAAFNDKASVLAGLTPGVDISISSGDEARSKSVIIRGRSSLKNAVTPLYIVDGTVVSHEEFSKLNVQDIREIAILKDANATAIYGNRGANGVVVISTKKGVSAQDLIDQDSNMANVQVRRDLDETAFFLPELYTDKEGNLSFTFTTPELLTQWKLRLLGHDKNGNSTQFEKTVVTQKEMSLVPNAPRFLRKGDTITFSTKIANLTSQDMNGTARLELFDATTLKPVDQIMGNTSNRLPFKAAAKGNTSVAWQFTVPEGIPAVNYRVVAATNKFSDGEENTLPVLTNRELVTESRTLWMRPDQEKTITLENLANNESATLSSHRMTLEYTSNPAWYAIKSLPYLMEYQYDCSEQLLSRYFADATAQHILNSNPKIKEVFDNWSQNESLESNLEKNEELKNIVLAHTPWLLTARSGTGPAEEAGTAF